MSANAPECDSQVRNERQFSTIPSDALRDWLAMLAAHAEHLERCRRAAHAARDVERRFTSRGASSRAQVPAHLCWQAFEFGNLRSIRRHDGERRSMRPHGVSAVDRP